MPQCFPKTTHILDGMQFMGEHLTLDLTDSQLIVEAIGADLGGVGNEKTLARYQAHLEHFSGYLAGRGRCFYSARHKDVSTYINHLSKGGGRNPHPMRKACEWCGDHGYPDGRKGSGWAPSYVKSHRSAIRFLYKHFFFDEGAAEHRSEPSRAMPEGHARARLHTNAG